MAILIAGVRQIFEKNPCAFGWASVQKNVKTVQISRQEQEYDTEKCVKGHKKFILVDPSGLILAEKIIGASVSERAASQLLLTKIHTITRLIKLCKSGIIK